MECHESRAQRPAVLPEARAEAEFDGLSVVRATKLHSVPDILTRDQVRQVIAGIRSPALSGAPAGHVFDAASPQRSALAADGRYR